MRFSQIPRLVFIAVMFFCCCFSGRVLAQPASGGNLINNVFLDTDLRQALQDIGVQAGVTIVPAPEVAGIITAEIKEKNLGQALDIVLAGTDYEWIEKADYFLVFSPSPESPAFSDVSQGRMIELQYVKAEQVMDLMPNLYKAYITVDKASDTVMITAPKKIMGKIAKSVASIDQRSLSAPVDPKSASFARSSQTKLVRLNFIGAKAAASLIPPVFKDFVSVGEETDRLMIVAEPGMLEKIEGIIRSIDLPPRHVHLDAKVVVMKHSDLMNLGVQWGFPVAQAGGFYLQNEWNWGVQLGLATDQSFTNSLLAALNLMEQNERASIIASPQVVAQDGKSAEIKVATEEYFKITSGVYNENLDLQKIETGTILQIAPKIADDNTINIDLLAEVSDVVARAQDDLPVITRRTATSSVRIKDGGTVAIAGLMDTRTQKVRQAVPGVSRIPVAGKLFENNKDEDTTEEVAIFVTARLVPDSLKTPEAARARESVPMVDVESFREKLRLSYKKIKG